MELEYFIIFMEVLNLYINLLKSLLVVEESKIWVCYLFFIVGSFICIFFVLGIDYLFCFRYWGKVKIKINFILKEFVC